MVGTVLGHIQNHSFVTCWLRRLTVKFPEPIRQLEVWQARIASINKDKTEYVLENQHWNAELKAEKTLEFPFTVTKKNNKRLRKIDVPFERLGEGSGMFNLE